MPKPKAHDPLHQLFEHFLLTRSYENAGQFTKVLAESYLAYLDSTPAHMPFEARQAVLEDLALEAHELLVKRMYGTAAAPIAAAARVDVPPSGKVHQYRDGKVVNPHPLHMSEITRPAPTENVPLAPAKREPVKTTKS